MAFHVPNEFRCRSKAIYGNYASDGSIGNNGCFSLRIDEKEFHVIASDGRGWEHVSVSLENRIPTWTEMCKIKNIFWDKDDCVIQYHPAEKDYVNIASNCLHLWRPIEITIPTPPKYMV